jgi:RHS repeat-associated protein
MRARAPSRIAAPLARLAALACLATPASAQLVEYYHTDLVGNVRAVTDEKKNVIERHDYLPFGEECTVGACASNPAVGAGQARKFTGKERDTETGLDYFGARYYGSRIGRFSTVDPALNIQAALVSPQRWNRYAYGLNNPLRNVDPDGRDAWDIATGAANAFGSNFSVGLGRRSAYNSDFAAGQFVGDLVSIPAGYAWGDAGAGIAAVGVVGAPESGGVTLVASAAGVGMMVQGGTASLAGLANAGIYLANNTREGMGFTKAGKKQIDQANADKYGGKNVCENCGTETVPGKRHEKGVSPPGSERQRDHIEPRSKGGKGIPDNGQVLCRECNIDKSNH